MKIEELRIHQKIYDKHGKEHTIAELHANGIIKDTNNQIIQVTDIEPIFDEPYISVDNFGHITLCIQSNIGLFTADADTIAETDHTALYLGFQPKDTDETIDMACIKNDADSKDLIMHTWTDITTDAYTTETRFSETDIRNAVDGE